MTWRVSIFIVFIAVMEKTPIMASGLAEKQWTVRELREIWWSTNGLPCKLQSAYSHTLGINMATETIQIRFNGKGVAEHMMDVQLFAPSILAFGTLCEETNIIANGGASRVKVFIKADLKPNCVTIELQIAQFLFEHITLLASTTNSTTINELLKWIGILGKASAGVLFENLIEYLGYKKDKKEVSAKTIETNNGGIIINVTFHGDNNTITVSPIIHELSKRPQIVEAIKRLTEPAAVSEGIDEMTFSQNGEAKLTIDKKPQKLFRNVRWNQ